MTVCERDQVNLWTRLRCFISTGTGVLYPSSLWNVNFKIQKKPDQRLIIGIFEKCGRETMGGSVYFAMESSGYINTCFFNLRFILSGTLEIHGESVLLRKSNQTAWNFLALQHKRLWVEITGHNGSSKLSSSHLQDTKDRRHIRDCPLASGLAKNLPRGLRCF